MTTPTIKTMTVEQILHKEAFKRIKPSRNLTQLGEKMQSGYADTSYNPNFNPLQYDFPTQSDFLREYDVHGHEINSIKEYPDQFLWMDGEAGSRSKLIRKVQTRVALAYQQYIHTKRVSTLTGNNIDLSIANKESGKNTQSTLAMFKEGWVVKNMENAIYRAISSDLKVGDAAIAFGKSEGSLYWRTMSFDKGDTLFPHYDPISGDMSLFAREYQVTETDKDGIVNIIYYLDVWDRIFYKRYRRNLTEKAKGEWITDIEALPHGFPFIPVAYHRYGAPCWGQSQNTISQLEMAMSQLAENNAQYALRILLLMGADMELVASSDGTPMMINSSDVNSKAGFLEPADASASFKLQLDKYEESILRDSFVVKTPEVKSGADMSSLTVKMLYAEAYQKAIEDSQEYQSFLNDVIRIFKEGYGVEIGKSAEFEKLKVKAEILPYIFMSETEVVNSVVQLVGVKALSKESASDIVYRILGYGTIDEAQRVLQEEHDAIVGTATQEASQEIKQNVINEFRETSK